MEKNPARMDFCTKNQIDRQSDWGCIKSNTENLDFLSGFTAISSLGKSITWTGRRFDEWNLIYVNSGELEIFPEKGSCRIDHGSLVLVAPGYSRRYRRSAETSLLFFHFKMKGHIDSAVEWEELQPGFFRYTPDRLSRRRCLAALLEVHSLALLRRRGWYNLAYSLLATVINRGNAGTTHSDSDEKSLEQAAILLTNLNKTQGMDEVAESCGISRTLFYEKFQRHFGMSPRAYREQQAFRAAQSLLENTDYTLEHIAQEIGFTDPFYFSRRFKIIFGVSPSEYRKRISGE